MQYNNDFTKGNVEQQLIRFAIPIIVGNLLMQLYNYIDSVILGKYLGKEALAAVGASSPFVYMLISLIIGISMGSSIIIAQYYGKKDFVNIRKAADSLYIFLIISALVLMVLGSVFNRQIMELIQLPQEIIPLAVDYLNIYMVGLLFLFIFNSLAAILRGVGDSKSPLIFLAISAIINIILDLIFVIILEWGIKGAAWATVVSQALAVVFAFYYTSKRHKAIPTNLFKLKFDKDVFFKGIKIGIPAGFQQLFASMGGLTIVSIVNQFGVDIIAGYSAAIRIEYFVFVFPINMSVALTSFTAQNYGARNMERIKKAIRFTLKVSFVASFTILILLSALAMPLMKMFSVEESVINCGVEYLYILGITYFISCFMFTYMGVLRGIGNTIAPMFITLLSLWLIKVPLAKILSETPLEEIGIWLSAPISWAVGAVAAYVCYARCKVSER
ncbi:MAG: MATE family efflux transporter [Rikenellaceae bacterium]